MSDQSPVSRDSTVKRWEKFIYSLAYPGILGSIIFDIADPLRDLSAPGKTSARAASVAVFIAFSIDWWHMTNNLKGIAKKPIFIALDFFMLICFGWSYYANAQITGDKFNLSQVPRNCILSMVMLMLAFFGVIVFEKLARDKLSKLEICLAFPIVSCMTGAIVSACIPDASLVANLFALWLSAFFYFCYILGYPNLDSSASV
jgi:hypothetical protein